MSAACRSSMEKLLLLVLVMGFSTASSKPNIIFILTDDQDSALDGMEPMRHTKKLIADEGLRFTNAFVSTPLCCPSRATILTGRYMHNHKTFNNSREGNCNYNYWRSHIEPKTFAFRLRSEGYTTFFIGKYLNQMSLRDLKRRPKGWSKWFAANSVRYYNYMLSNNGASRPLKYYDADEDYSTDVMSEKVQDFLSKDVEPGKPFFMMISTIAPHGAEHKNGDRIMVAPKYEEEYLKEKAPRTPNYNVVDKTKHWLLTQAHPMTHKTIKSVDVKFRNRWGSLLSVDDLVKGIVDTLEEKELLNNTYILLSSDNGYHMGQFGLPAEKREPYEADIRVPLVVRGPGVPAGQTSDAAVVATDFAPTFLELAGITNATGMDGISFVPLLTNPGKPWRTSFLLEYRGEGNAEPKPLLYCPSRLDDPNVKWCAAGCVCQDARNNTFNCIRTMTELKNTLFCDFYEENPKFVEFYDLNKDPCQLVNLAYNVNRDAPQYLPMFEKLSKMQNCKGKICAGIEMENSGTVGNAARTECRVSE